MPPPAAPRSTRSYAVENTIALLVVPVSALLVPWIWFGRAFLGAGGWYLFIFTVTLVPLLVVALTLTCALSFTQRRSPDEGRLTLLQACLHVALWVALFMFGLCWVDFGDSGHGWSVLSVRLGGSKQDVDLSMGLALGAAAVAAVTWTALLGSLVAGNRNARRRRLSEAQWRQPHAAPPGPPRH
ncbi:hypothetical protein FE697_000640 [Mumia zhuanghuii]|uniref:Uncharacterized protein n=2 Tax=Mumia TaxID=1546255 RepID=A0ABW1QPG5_9ACTN|nr:MULTISPECIES: hypothetical protein [Mumia]KAA1424477.1 hypothetical protein FE697_000640 [Mumia zhuanghuii]